MMNDANDAVKLIRAFAKKMGQGHSTITFDPDAGCWTLRFDMKIRGELYVYRWTITEKEFAYMQHPDAKGVLLAEGLRHDMHAKAQEAKP